MKSGAWHLLATLERRFDALESVSRAACSASELDYLRGRLHRALLDSTRHDAELIELYIQLDAHLQRFGLAGSSERMSTLQYA